MRRCLIICAVALTACGDKPAPARVPADLLAPCDGWQHGVPETQGDLMRAAAAERAGRICANGKLVAIGEIVSQ